MFKSWKEIQEEEEREEEYAEHYFLDGSLKPGYYEGYFRPSSYDDMVTHGQATRNYYEALRNKKPLDRSDIIDALIGAGLVLLAFLLFGWYCSL